MPRNHINCPVDGCGKATHGRPYCDKHIDVSQRRALSAARGARIRSACCAAACKPGKAHDNGEQYCTKCGEACTWRSS
jgi:hypothetical protein